MSIILNGTTGITTPDVDAESYTGPLAVNASAPDDSVVVDASGNVGIGTSSPARPLDVRGSLGMQVNEDGAGTKVLSLRSDYAGVGPAINVTTNNPLLLMTNNTERARIDSSGNVMVGQTSASGQFSVTTPTVGKWSGYFNANNYGVAIRLTQTGYASFFYTPTGFAGYIYVDISTNTTSYATASDYRLKENIVPMTGALAKVAALKPCTYTWKSSGVSGQGFIAHEMQEVVPDCVTGEKDAVDAEGNPVYQGVDTSFLVATLTAAIQEQQAIIESLTARVVALEGQP